MKGYTREFTPSFILTIVLILTACKEKHPLILLPNDQITAKISFGSCSREYEPQILWDDILNDQPDLWIWLGDNIYGDSADPEVLQEKYGIQKSNPGYKDLREQTAIYGIWDDHDYGLNDGGSEFGGKAMSRDLMFEFLEVPKDNSAWSRKGGYQSYHLNINNVTVKLILLDSRYFRDLPTRVGKQYLPNLQGTILGELQWEWLKEELSSVNEDLVIIGNGIQVLPEEHRYEKWANFPRERQRLIDLISQSENGNFILLSGDRHLTEVSKIDQGKIIYEITCSGMTHTYTNFIGEPNKHRVGKVITGKNYGLLKISKNNEELKVVFDSKGDNGKVFQTVALNY